MKKNGFTLVELLAVIVVLAIIIGIASSSTFRLVKRAREQTASEMRLALGEAGVNYVMGNIHLEKCPVGIEINDTNKENVTFKNCFVVLKSSKLIESEFEDPGHHCYVAGGEDAEVIVYRFNDGISSDYKAYVNEEYCLN